MLEALIDGRNDPVQLSQLAKGRLRSKILVLTEALTGHFTAHHAFMTRLFLDRIDAHTADIDKLSARIDEAMAPFRPARDLLISIPGFSTTVAEIVIAETGGDMRVFPTAGHLASWAGTAPGCSESAGRVESTKTRPGNRYLKGALSRRRPRRLPLQRNLFLGEVPAHRRAPPSATASPSRQLPNRIQHRHNETRIRKLRRVADVRPWSGGLSGQRSKTTPACSKLSWAICG